MTFARISTAADELRDTIIGIIRNDDAQKPRARQAWIGPSEVGHPCARRIAYRLWDTDKTNTSNDPWAAISGTAIHAWLADAFTTAGDRWLVEHRVKITTAMSGTVDLYDKNTGTVIDHKTAGATSMKKYKTDGPSEQHIVQLHLYAHGLAAAGHDVKRVALAYYPLGGFLTGMHVHVQDYDPQIAVDALERIDTIRTTLVLLNVEQQPANWSLIPKTPTACHWCPWYQPNALDPAAACDGDTPQTTAA